MTVQHFLGQVCFLQACLSLFLLHLFATRMPQVVLSLIYALICFFM